MLRAAGPRMATSPARRRSEDSDVSEVLFEPVLLNRSLITDSTATGLNDRLVLPGELRDIAMSSFKVSERFDVPVPVVETGTGVHGAACAD